MASSFKIIEPVDIQENPFQAIGQEWMLILAGTEKRFNMMTASWGAWGVLWHKPVAFCFVRPQRLTYQFLEEADAYSLNFFGPEYKSVLDLCGSKSGRDIDKPKAAGLTVKKDDSGALVFEQARLAVVCKKIYFQQIDPEHFLDPSIIRNYPQEDYHRMYVGQIVRVLKKV